MLKPTISTTKGFNPVVSVSTAIFPKSFALFIYSVSLDGDVTTSNLSNL